MTLCQARLCAVLLFLVSLAVCVSAAGDGFTFVQIADTQLGFVNKNENMDPELASFANAVDQINRLRPAFVVISGDMINRPHDIAQIRAFWRIAREINPDIPLHLVPGNHELQKSGESEVRSYTRLFGPDHYSFTCGNSTFVVLNSSLICSPQADARLRAEQWKWFDEQLTAARTAGSRHVFVLTHHPWFVSTPDEANDYYNIPLPERTKYLLLMKQRGVDFALAGHCHKEAGGQDGGLTMITTAALSRNFNKDPVGFRVFTVRGDKVEHHYYGLNQVPDRIAP